MEELLNRLVAAVAEHYPAADAPPLRLSTFGSKHKALVQELRAHFPTLKHAIRAEERLRLIDNTVGSEAVAPTEFASQVSQKLEESNATQKKGASNFDCLPFSVQTAFVYRVNAGEHITIDTTRPFRFSKITDPGLIRPTQRIIAEQYRRPGLVLRNASVQDRAALWRQFVTWCEAVGVDPNVFQDSSTTALGRLLAAQPREIISQVVIPADIAQLLMKHA